MKSSKTSAPKRPDLTIVIPALHEEKRIGATLDNLAAFLKSDDFFRQKTVEIIVVAADTTDRTQEIVLGKQTLFRQLKLLKPGSPVGKGRDVQYGVLRAAGNIVVFMDADLATPLHHLQIFYTACTEGNDMVVGTRNLLKYRPSKLRSLYSTFGNALYRMAGGIRVEDTQCGFKMFTARAAYLCFTKLTILGWGFDMELLAIAKANKLKIKPYRISDWKHMPYSTHTDGTIKIAVRNVRDFGLIAINRLRGVYTN